MIKRAIERYKYLAGVFGNGGDVWGLWFNELRFIFERCAMCGWFRHAGEIRPSYGKIGDKFVHAWCYDFWNKNKGHWSGLPEQ